MKKYLMSGIAALAISAGFTSCSHNDDFEPMSQAQIDKSKYDQAFLDYVGGTIASNQDWGFSNRDTRAFTRALGDYDNYKGSWQPTFTAGWDGNTFSFPTDCDASKFVAAVPEGTNKFPADGEVRDGGIWFIDNTTTRVNLNTTPGTIYVKGNVDLTSKMFEIKEGSEIYLPVGSSLKLDANSSNQLKAAIYIASGATLETPGVLKMDNTGKVYNHGTIKAGSFEVNSNCFLYNVGTMTLTGKAYLANQRTAVVNDGTITCSEVGIEGSANVQNNAEWTVTGNTIVNSNDASWVNNGHWTTGYYKYTAGSENVINNCFLEVKEDFDINLGDGGGTRGFKIDAGGGVLTKNFNGGKGDNSVSGPYRVIMGSKAVFKVTGTAALAAGNEGTWNGGPKYGYGFFGPDNGDYAVFQATHIVKAGNDTDKKVRYGGNLYVSAEDHFASEYDPWNQNITYSLGFTKENIFTTNNEDEFSSGKPVINITRTLCNPGFEGEEVAYDLRIWAEDLSATESGDFDFNDVVLDVKYDDSNAIICLRAAGGTLPLRIAGNDNWEVHKLFQEANEGKNITESTMINTAPGKHTEYKVAVIETHLQVKDAAQANTVLKLEVFKNNTWEEMLAPLGEPSCKLAVDKNLDWLDERTSIKGKYEKFVPWAQENNPNLSQWWK